jgi:hypothetical protein
MLCDEMMLRTLCCGMLNAMLMKQDAGMKKREAW